jgi:hypothetical protein
MKTKLLLFRVSIFAFVIFFSAAKPTIASHASGGSLSYTHLTGNVYRMHAILYRDCFGITPPAILDLDVKSISCNVSLQYQMLPLPGTGNEITLVCPGVVTTCQGGNIPGFEKYEYEADVPITGQCADWLFSFSISARSAAITTLLNPGGDNIYVEARLNNVNADNNSPVFTNDPIIIVRKDDDIHYNLGMFDADGDSLVYNLVAPLQAQNISVVYNLGYNTLNPLSSNPPVSLDLFTGDLFMHPTALEVGVIAFEILDYRNGEPMGKVLRDILIYTFPTANSDPTATHMNGTSQQFAYVFPGDTICFDIFSNDIDANDTVTMTWNATISSATFITTGLPFPTGTFCWIPTINEVRSQPYMFTAMVRDDFCPTNNANIYSYFIYVTLDSSLVFLHATQISVNSHLSIFPNPSDGIFEISPEEKISQVTVFDSFGKCILKSKSARFDLSNQRKGIYYAEVLMHDGKMQYHKIVRQ